MKRISITERDDWKSQADALGFNFHTFDGDPYWDESACYQFSLKQIEDDIEDPSVFALEEHLQSFLIRNWDNTLLGKNYKIFEEEGQSIGVEYQTDNGYIDILAISNDKKVLLVIELKRGRASDRVVGQILNYMGYISSEVAESDQTVRGCIIALEDDQRIRNALRIVDNIEFYKYEINFNLSKVKIT